MVLYICPQFQLSSELIPMPSPSPNFPNVLSDLYMQYSVINANLLPNLPHRMLLNNPAPPTYCSWFLDCCQDCPFIYVRSITPPMPHPKFPPNMIYHHILGLHQEVHLFSSVHATSLFSSNFQLWGLIDLTILYSSLTFSVLIILRTEQKKPTCPDIITKIKKKMRMFNTVSSLQSCRNFWQ